MRDPAPHAALAIALLAGCGGASAPAPGAETTAPQPTSEPEPAPPHDEDLEEALTAYGRGELTSARDALARVLRRSPEDSDARRLGARVASALGNDEGALALLEGSTDPELLALEARLLIRAERLVTVARRLAPVLEGRGDEEAPGDEVLRAYLAIARAGAVEDLYEAEGETSELPLDPASPLPVVDVVLDDGETSKALVASSADLLVLHDGAAARLARFRGNATRDGGSGEPIDGGLVGTLRLGGARLDRVPFVTRDLSAIATQLGVPVVAVVGLDVLIRMRATLDGPGAKLVVRPVAWEDGSRPPGGAGFATFSGSHLAVRARLTERVGGYMLVDSAGLFPLAVVPEAVVALGIDGDDLSPVPGGPGRDVGQFALPAVRVGDVVLESVPAIAGLTPEGLGASIGAPIAGLIGELVLERFALTFDGEARRLRIR